MRKPRTTRPHFTVSRLQALRLCAYRHHLQYDLGIRVGGPASRRGIALHEAVSGLLLRWGKTSLGEEV
ncbi:MAG: PD-(D/E)XK nuclease family protein, partial [Deltaproteobacteria bacterium]|nr:PD-(D/E)XK nuclease family protein [Deltaproteobacteria bacterium]